jgi:hypothetical protein
MSIFNIIGHALFTIKNNFFSGYLTIVVWYIVIITISIIGGFLPGGSLLIGIFVTSILTYGLFVYSLNITNGLPGEISYIFDGFKFNYIKIVLNLLIRQLIAGVIMVPFFIALVYFILSFLGIGLSDLFLMIENIENTDWYTSQEFINMFSMIGWKAEATTSLLIAIIFLIVGWGVSILMSFTELILYDRPEERNPILLSYHMMKSVLFKYLGMLIIVFIMIITFIAILSSLILIPYIGWIFTIILVLSLPMFILFMFVLTASFYRSRDEELNGPRIKKSNEDDLSVWNQ